MPTEAQRKYLEQIGSECFCLQSRMTARAVTRAYNSVLQSIGLEITEFSLLVAIEWGDEPSIAGLAERLAFERTTLVRNLNRMAKRGLIEQADEKGRSVRYVLTARGRKLLNEAAPLWTRAQAAAVKGLEEKNRGSVLVSLKALRKAVKPPA